MPPPRRPPKGWGILSAYRDIGEEHSGKVWTDASAALGVIQRKGLGKTRHIHTHHLWIQEAAAKQRLAFNKIKGTEHCADLMTKHLDQQTIAGQLPRMSVTINNTKSQMVWGITSVARNPDHEDDNWDWRHDVLIDTQTCDAEEVIVHGNESTRRPHSSWRSILATYDAGQVYPSRNVLHDK